MIAVDTNILVHAHRLDMPFHDRATACILELAMGSNGWAIPWPCIHEFYNVVTHPNRFKLPTPPSVALSQLQAWIASPSLRMIAETSEHLSVLSKLASKAQIQGPRIHDARIAAICLQHSVREFWTADRDFSRFPQLKCKNPLIAV